MLHTPERPQTQRKPFIDIQEARQAFPLFAKDGQVIEIRALGATLHSDRLPYDKPRVIAGWFDNVEAIISELGRIANAEGIYITINPCERALLARANNRLKDKKVTATTDQQIVRRQYLLLDADPEREGHVTGIPTNEREHQTALDFVQTVSDELKRRGWTDPIELDSGNGAYLSYAIDLPADDNGLIERVLKGLAQRFDTGQVHIDQTTFNQSRIARLPGTMNCKGDGTEDRPHRMAKILSVPDEIRPVPIELLEAIAVPAEQEQPKREQKTANKNTSYKKDKQPPDFLDEWNVAYGSQQLYNNGWKWQLEEGCPFCSNNDHNAFVYIDGSVLGFQCSHNSCKGKYHWHEFRCRFDQEYASRDWSKDNSSNHARTGQKGTSQGNETAASYEEVKARVLKAVGSKDVDAIYSLADRIVVLSTQQQASVGSIIEQNKKNLAGFRQRDFNNCLKEAKTKRQKIEHEGKISKAKEGDGVRAFIDIGNVASREIRSECIRVLRQSNDPPSLLVQGNELCRVLHEKYKREDIDGKEREYSRSYIERHTDISLLNRLIDVADFGDIVEKDDDVILKYKLPETRLASLVLTHDEKPYPHITGITSVPILRPSGDISTVPGYDNRSHLWYAPADDLADLRIPESPTQEDALKAVEVIDDILHDFCFASKKDRTHTFAALLTPLLRSILGNVPLCNVDAPVQGTGKSLLCEIIVTVATLGAYATLVAPQSNPKYPEEAEEEWRKAILANLMQGYPIVVIDNLPRGCNFSCAALDSALTHPEMTGRILGQSNMVTAPSRAIWICNGNNITIVGDTARKAYHIRLDARSSKPWLRKGFRYDNIISTVREKRADIITALLTIIRAWFVAEKPPAENRVRMGSFEEWSDILGGILDFIGMEGFLSDLQGQSDEGKADDEWVPFIEAWYERFPDQEHIQKELHAWFSGAIVYPGTQAMPELLPGSLRVLAEKDEAKFKTALQKSLKKMNDVCFGQKNIRLEIRYNTAFRQDTWKVCLPDVNPEPEHSGAFRSTYSDNHNCSDSASEAYSEDFSGAPEHFHSTHTKKNNIFSHSNNEEKNIISPYVSNNSSGYSGDTSTKPHVEPDRSHCEPQSHVLRNAPVTPECSDIYSDTNSSSIPEEHRSLYVDYCKKVDSLPVSTPTWQAPSSGHKNTMFGKNEHKMYTRSLLRSGEVGKIKAALEAMKRTLDIWED